MGLEERTELFCEPWRPPEDTESPAVELVAAGRAAEVGGGEEAVAAPTGRGARSARCAASGTGWLWRLRWLRGPGLGPQGRRAGARARP